MRYELSKIGGPNYRFVKWTLERLFFFFRESITNFGLVRFSEKLEKFWFGRKFVWFRFWWHRLLHL